MGFCVENIHSGFQPQTRTIVNYTVTDGVAPITVWHERLGHTCPQYLKVMADNGMVKGVILTQRQLKSCGACHLGKQSRRKHQKSIERNITKPNQVIYADLMYTLHCNLSDNG